jgi:pyrroloquinoline-quinone synthase
VASTTAPIRDYSCILWKGIGSDQWGGGLGEPIGGGADHPCISSGKTHLEAWFLARKPRIVMTITDVAPSKDELAEMTPEEFVALIRTECTKPGRGMQDHPIVHEMEAGTVTVPQLTLFTEQFYQHISRMLPWIGAIYVRCPHEEVRTALVKNLAEECTGYQTETDAHPQLLLKFAEALGADLDAIKSAEQMTEGRRLTDYFEFMGLCREWYVPLSAIGIGLESFVPDTFTRVVAAMKKNYDMTDEQLIFWTMHIIADQDHGDEGVEMVSAYALTAEARKDVFDCTVETSRLFHDMWMLYNQA